jgi:hypothetical protein
MGTQGYPGVMVYTPGPEGAATPRNRRVQSQFDETDRLDT